MTGFFLISHPEFGMADFLYRRKKFSDDLRSYGIFSIEEG